jgi:hypothetical protein
MVSAIVSPDKLQVPAGAVLIMQATWQDYQQLIEQRGDPIRASNIVRNQCC